MRLTPRLLLLSVILLAPACSQPPVAGTQAGFHFALAALETLDAPTSEPTRDLPTPTPPPPAAAIPTAPPEASPTPSPTPSGGVVYTGGGGSGGGGAPPPPPTPTPPGVAIAPADGGFRDSGATETGVVGP